MQIFRVDPMRHDVAAQSVAWMQGTHTELNLTHVNSRGWGASPEEQSQERQDAISGRDPEFSKRGF